MRTTIDKAGRVVIPKAVRDALGLRGGEEIEISMRDGHVEIEPAPVPMRLVRHEDGFPVAQSDVPIPPLTAEEVRETLERVRERH